MLTTGLTILTHVPADSTPGVSQRLPEALRSLQAISYTGPVCVVDDGSTHSGHLRTLESLPYQVHRMPVSRGIARAKNACLTILQAWGVDIGFIAEDDIEFRPGWDAAYRQAHEQTGIHHFSWAWDDCRPWGEMWKCQRFIHNFPIAQTSLLNGVLLTCTPTVIQSVGGFKIMPAARWGHEHTNWTKRIIDAGLAPHFCDVMHSNQLIGLNRFAGESSVSVEEKILFGNLNEAAANELRPLYHPLEV